MDKMNRIVAGVLAAGGLLVCTCAAGDGLMPPTSEEGDFPWGAVLYTLVAVAGIAAVAFKNARRTHLD